MACEASDVHMRRGVMKAPLPKLTPENTAFWTGGLDGKLLIMACGDCDHRIHPPQLVCPNCLSENVAPRQASGLGTIYSFTINRQAWMPGLDVPYALVIVDLDDQPGVRLTTRLAGWSGGGVEIGAKVEVDFEPSGDVAIPTFRLAGADA